MCCHDVGWNLSIFVRMCLYQVPLVLTSSLNSRKAVSVQSFGSLQHFK
jgi:hypothetical protein